MSNGAAITTILDYMANTIETVELTTYGLKHAYGSAAPNNLEGYGFPITMRWLKSTHFYNEESGYSLYNQVGPQEATYHVNVFLILGTGDPPATMYSAVNTWVERVRDAYLKYCSRNGLWQSAKVIEAAYAERQMGQVLVYGIDYDVVILAITTPPVGA